MKIVFGKKNYNAKKIYEKDKTILFILGVSMSFSILLFLLGFFTLVGAIGFFNNIITGIDFLVFGLLSIIGPIGFYNHLKAKKKREIETTT